MAMASGIGATLDLPEDAGLLFGEDQARYIIATANPEAIEAKAGGASVPVRRLGKTGGADLTLGSDSIAVKALKDAHEGWLPAYMAGQD